MKFPIKPVTLSLCSLLLLTACSQETSQTSPAFAQTSSSQEKVIATAKTPTNNTTAPIQAEQTSTPIVTNSQPTAQALPIQTQVQTNQASILPTKEVQIQAATQESKPEEAASPLEANQKTNEQTRPANPLSEPVYQAGIPQAFVGTWVGKSEQADFIQVTIAADGGVETSVRYNHNPEQTEIFSARIDQSQLLTDSAIILNQYQGDYAALIAGTNGLGGWLVQYPVGYLLEAGTLQINLWNLSIFDSLDPQQPALLTIQLSPQEAA
ncbi:hypothetical protein [Streptococcus suis]|uniref:hypothetical protein n=1 Tax=Streptococcus suis TaxID=1307 RepID=UPI001ABDA274|nr:hypothetical protein [Streptococcus suis]